MRILKIAIFVIFCIFLTELYLLDTKIDNVQDNINILNVVVDPQIKLLKEEKDMKEKIADIEKIRDEYLIAYPEYKPRIALKLIERTADAPLIALPEALRKSIIDLGLGEEIERLPNTIHKPTFENTGPVLSLRIPQ